jgi:excisionase family DNA binding protein
MSTPTPKYARTRQTAEYLGISAKSLIRMVNARVVPVHKVNGRLWLFRLAEVDAALDRFRTRLAGEGRT